MVKNKVRFSEGAETSTRGRVRSPIRVIRAILATASKLWLNLFGREGLLFLTEFLETRIAAQWIEHGIEPEQCGSERRSGECAKVRCGE